jgi:hypothetical protein
MNMENEKRRAEDAERLPAEELEWEAQDEPLTIALGQGKIEVGQGHHGHDRLPAILFGRNGAGAVGIETEGDRFMEPGECIAAITFENPESLDVVAEKLAELRARIWPGATPAAPAVDAAKLDDLGKLKALAEAANHLGLSGTEIEAEFRDTASPYAVLSLIALVAQQAARIAELERLNAEPKTKPVLMAYVATDLDGHYDVGTTIAQAKQRAGDGCDTIFPLHDISPAFIEFEGNQNNRVECRMIGGVCACQPGRCVVGLTAPAYALAATPAVPAPALTVEQATAAGWRIKQDDDGVIVVQKDGIGGVALSPKYHRDEIAATIFEEFLRDLLATSQSVPAPDVGGLIPEQGVGAMPDGTMLGQAHVMPPVAAPVSQHGEWVSGWCSIESAPRDGTMILLGRAEDDAEHSAVSTAGRWHKGYGDGVDEMGHDDGFMDVDFDMFTCPRSFGSTQYQTVGFQPTHWMAMPPAPDQSAANECREGRNTKPDSSNLPAPEAPSDLCFGPNDPPLVYTPLPPLEWEGEASSEQMGGAPQAMAAIKPWYERKHVGGTVRNDVVCMGEEIDELRAALATQPSGDQMGGAQVASWRDKLRWSKANTDYHGYIAFTPGQLEHFVSMLTQQAAPEAPTSDSLTPQSLALLRKGLRDWEKPKNRYDAQRVLDAIEGAQVAKAETVRMSDEEIDIIWQTMPGGPGAWLKGFGYQAFAKAIEDEVILNHQRDFATDRAAQGEATERKPLTDAEILEIFNEQPESLSTVGFARAIEQHHGITGGGK